MKTESKSQLDSKELRKQSALSQIKEVLKAVKEGIYMF